MSDAERAIDGFTHEIFVLAAQGRLNNSYDAELATRLANYQTHYQMSLDLNQPSEIRIEHHVQAVVSMWELADRMFP